MADVQEPTSPAENWWTALINSSSVPTAPTEGPQIAWDQRYPGGTWMQLVTMLGLQPQPQPPTEPTEPTE